MDIVARLFAFAHILNLKEFEAQLYKDYRCGSKSLEEVYKELKQFLNQHSTKA